MLKDNRHDYGNYELFDNILNKSVGKTLRNLRIEKGLKQSDLIKKMNNIITEPTLSRYESGGSKVRMKAFLSFAKAFDMTPQELIDKINDTYMEDVKKNIKVLEEYYDIQN